MQHSELVNLCDKIAKNFGAWKGWPDPIPPWGNGENPDWFGVFKDFSDELWRDSRGESVKCWPGDTLVLECKISTADFEADRAKPWRSPHASALGNFRLYVAPLDIVPVHKVVDPWGLIEVDDAGAPVMSKPPMRVNMPAVGRQNLLFAKLIDGNTPQHHSNGGGISKAAPKLGAFDQVESLLAKERDPVAVGWVRNKLDITTNASALATQLKRDARFNVETDGGKSVVSLAAEAQTTTHGGEQREGE